MNIKELTEQEVPQKYPITGTQAKQADRYAIDVLKIPSLDLMQRASEFVAREVLDHHPGKRVLVICGIGNNGADGVCIARLLKEDRRDVSVLICGELKKATWEFLWQLALYRKEGGAPVYMADLKKEVSMAPVGSLLTDTFPASVRNASADIKASPNDTAPDTVTETRLRLPEADILIDAVFGIGLKRTVEGDFKELLQAVEKHVSYKIAVDVPSGINADSGVAMGVYIHADCTFTFGRNKTGLLTGAGREASGEVSVCDIGIPDSVYNLVCTG